jgi:hypothetical protein
MSKAEKFIQDYTRNCSNEMEGPLYANPKLNFYPWLTPDQARRAVEIAREEIYEWIRNNIKNYVYMDIDALEGHIDVDEVINDLNRQ